MTEALERRLDTIQNEMRASAARASRPRERKGSAPPGGGATGGLPASSELVSSALRSVRYVYVTRAYAEHLTVLAVRVLLVEITPEYVK